MIVYTKSVAWMACVLILSIALTSCTTFRYSSSDIPGIRQVDKFDGETHIGTFYQKYDKETGGWFWAVKDDTGEWNFTPLGRWERNILLKKKYGEGNGTE